MGGRYWGGGQRDIGRLSQNDVVFQLPCQANESVDLAKHQPINGVQVLVQLHNGRIGHFFGVWHCLRGYTTGRMIGQTDGDDGQSGIKDFCQKLQQALLRPSLAWPGVQKCNHHNFPMTFSFSVRLIFWTIHHLQMALFH